MEVLVQAELQLMSRAAVKQFQKPLSDLFQTEQRQYAAQAVVTTNKALL